MSYNNLLPAPGKPGNPYGLPAPKLWANHLRYALIKKRADPNNPGKKQQAIRMVADKLISCALEGQRWAFEIIGDRVDGVLVADQASAAGITIIVNRGAAVGIVAPQQMQVIDGSGVPPASADKMPVIGQQSLVDDGKGT